MSKGQLVINCVLAVAVAALFYVFFSSPRKTKTEEVQLSGEHLPIAFVNSDSILLHYTFAIEANERLMSKQEEATVRLDEKFKAFQRDYETFQREAMDFQKKLESNAFLSRERAESEQARLQQKQDRLVRQQQDLENLQAQLREDFLNEQQKLNLQLIDSVQQFLKEYNADGRYHAIINDAVVLNKVGGYDITDEVVEGLNKRAK